MDGVLHAVSLAEGVRLLDPLGGGVIEVAGVVDGVQLGVAVPTGLPLPLAVPGGVTEELCVRGGVAVALSVAGGVTDALAVEGGVEVPLRVAVPVDAGEPVALPVDAGVPVGGGLPETEGVGGGELVGAAVPTGVVIGVAEPESGGGVRGGGERCTSVTSSVVLKLTAVQAPHQGGSATLPLAVAVGVAARDASWLGDCVGQSGSHTTSPGDGAAATAPGK